MRKLFHILRIFGRNVRGRKLEPEAPFLPSLLGGDDVCLHIGASDGRHSYLMSKLLTGGHIYAFEPSSYTLGVFRTLVRLHGLRNVSTFHMALSDADGTVRLTTPAKSRKHLGHSFSRVSRQPAARAGTEDRTEEVQARRLDDMVKDLNLSRVDFIRCDTEGSEMAILNGGQETIARHLPTFLIEIHPVALREDFHVDPQDVVARFLGLGYRMFMLRDGQVVETTSLLPDRPWYDYFFIHPSRAGHLPQGVFRDLMGAAAV